MPRESVPLSKKIEIIHARDKGRSIREIAKDLEVSKGVILSSLKGTPRL